MTLTTLKKVAEIFSETLAPIYISLKAETPHQHSCESLKPHLVAIFLTYIFSF